MGSAERACRLLQRTLACRKVLDHQTGVDEVEGTLFEIVTHDVVAPHLDPLVVELVEESHVDICDDHLPLRSHLRGEPPGDGARAPADLQAAPSTRHARGAEHSLCALVVQRRQSVQTIPFPFPRLVEDVCAQESLESEHKRAAREES